MGAESRSSAQEPHRELVAAAVRDVAIDDVGGDVEWFARPADDAVVVVVVRGGQRHRSDPRAALIMIRRSAPAIVARTSWATSGLTEIESMPARTRNSANSG